MPFFALMFLFYFEDRPLPLRLSAPAFMGCMEHLLVSVVLFAAIEAVGKRRWRWMVLPVTLGILYAAVILLASSGERRKSCTVLRCKKRAISLKSIPPTVFSFAVFHVSGQIPASFHLAPFAPYVL